jgi:hypothetical protein
MIQIMRCHKRKWSPSFGLSCIDCPDPNAPPSQTTQYGIEVQNEGEFIAKDHMTLMWFVTRETYLYQIHFHQMGEAEVSCH